MAPVPVTQSPGLSRHTPQEPTAQQPAIMSFYQLTTEERLRLGIKDTLIRYAVGIEDAEVLIDDLAEALDRVFKR